MADLVKLKTGKIDKLASVDQDNKPVVPLEAGNVYFAVDTTTHKGKIVYDAPNGTSVDRIVMSTDAEKADSADKALTADKAVTLVAARNIDGINFNGGANVIHYTTCATNASKVEKIVTINGFALISGARISVRFANTNSANNPTLNVSGTGAKPILYNGTNIPTAYLTNNKVWDFIYDGDLDAWIFVGDKNIDTNTTYTEATATKSGLMSASDKTKLDTIQSGAKVVNYESHLASGVKVGTITIGGTATDIFSTPDTWTAFKGATADAAGSAGYIGNAPAAGEQNAFFTGAGTWKTLTVANDKNNGLMSSDDRTKLDSIESNANYTYLNADAPISVNKHVGTITISHNASGATAGTYGTNSSTALTPGFGESFSVTGFQINATGHVTSASNHNVKMPDTLVDDTHRGLMSSDMYLAWNKGITLAGHQLLLGSAWSKTDFLDTLGLTNALRWIGNATVAIADGSKTDPKITGYDFSKAKPGDVVLDKDNKREYAWTLAGAWESLGLDGDLATADHRHANATSTTDGFMSADDKAKLDTVESKANYIYVSANAPISVDKHVGALTITHNTSGVTAGAYGDTVAQAPGFGASFLVPNLTVNATGHVTVAGAHTVTIPNALVTDKTNGLMSADDKARFDIIKDGYYVKRAGDTMTGDLCFSNVGTGVRQIQFLTGDNDYGRLAVSATGVNAGWMELATADDGTEPIYVRQYTGSFANVKRTLTLLDASGNTILPGTLTAAGATINGATTVNSTLHTTGATTLDSTLSVGGTATMKGALNVNGITNLGSSLTVSSGASIGGALSVSGNTTLNGTLTVNKAATFNAGATITTGGLWVQGGSAAGSNNSRFAFSSGNSTSNGMPDAFPFNGGKRGTKIYSNGIAFADPYNGNSNNDAGWMRHIEESVDNGYLEIGVGDNGTEPIYVRQYDKTPNITHSATLLGSNGASSFPVSVTAPTMYTSNWFRSTGQTGWCSETYGGGWYMTDSTWIRAFNGKSIYAGGAVIRTDGQFQVGDNGNKFKVDGNGNETLAGTLDSSNYRMGGASNPQNANNVVTTGLWYYTRGGPSTSLGASTTDGALYSEAYSSTWVGQIAQDYLNGNLFVRGKNNGSWTGWKAIVSSDSYSMTFHWNDQGGQPTRLWGGNSVSDMYVYNPSNFHVKEANALVYTGGRIASANISHGDGRLYYYMATSSMTTGKPPWDSHILHMSWDNTGGWDSQIALASGENSGRMAVRTQNAGTWTAWRQLAFLDEVTKSRVGLGSVANIDQSKAIKSITRSGTTFTATALDGTKTTFDQQDTNTTYSDATTSSAGLMSASDKTKLDGIASGANKYSHPGYTARSSGLYKITVDSTGHVSSVASVAKSDITALGIPGQDTNTTYSDATTSAHGLMTAADKAKLNGIASGATKNASTVKSFTLSASSWSDWTQSISDSLITATSNQEVLPAIGISKEQLIAFQKAMIVDAGQSTGKFTLRVMGTLPTIDIPIRVIFRGTI